MSVKATLAFFPLRISWSFSASPSEDPNAKGTAMSCTRPGLSKALLFVVMSGVAVCGRAATKTWSGLPDSKFWSNGDNWNGGIAPLSGDDLVFPLSYLRQMTNDLAEGILIPTITFSDNGYTLEGNAIRLSHAGCTSSAGSGINTIAVPILVSGGLDLSTANGCSLVLSGAITGAGGTSAQGSSPVILSGDSSYSGPTLTSLAGGYLIVNGTLSGTSGVTVEAISSTSTLRGSGTFSAPLIAEALSPDALVVIAPGQPDATGILRTGAATFGLYASLVVRLNGATAGAEYDQLHVDGSVDLGLTAFLDVASLGFTPSWGTAFTILENGGGAPISGTFVGLPEGSTFVKGATKFQISYVGGAGHDVVLTVVSPAAAPAALAVDAAGNGVLEPGELAILQPTWTNISGADLHLTGSTANFTGPAGAAYFNPDASGDYGTLADGTSSSCVDCYEVQATPVTERPVGHWDATIDEILNSGSVSQTWTLHMGESFGDVPTSHPFYAFVENLFHNGVTAGCGDATYCPDVPVTRAQMAVFLLKGERDSSYLPPACTSTVFSDVPCPGGAFVDWVNRLSSEGITAGCGGGRYCPNDPVNRGQMAVFLLKAEHGGGYAPPACAATVFDDVPCPGAQFVDWINQLVSEDITAGCGGVDYCPEAPVDRGQMAAFLVKTFSLVLYGL